MQCSICQFGNPEGARFCNQCGTFLYTTDHAAFPPQSFEEILARVQRYLPQGLTKKILSQRDRIEGERRQVTVMFCDMEGFTALADRLREEVVYTVMGQIYEILIAQVHDYEGTINEMTGDGIMALFGAPIAIEDAPQRALWAARAIHREIAAFNRKREGLGPIRMRIGIHSGPVVVGTLGNDLRVEFKAVGDTVNLASRMEGLAQPGTTYVTGEVYKQTREMFEFEALGKKIIKGKEESISVYKVLPSRKGVRRPRLGSERLIFSDMVGRQSKLDKLELHVAKLINGTGSIVNIIGEAGIGKSRLLAELKQREIMQRVLLLEGRAISMGLNLSFHPIVDLLKGWASIRIEDGESEAFIKLDIAVRELFQEQAGEILPFVATLMGLGLPAPYSKRLDGIEGESLEKLIRKSMRDLFKCLSKSSPLVIVVDDLHWSDRSSIELLVSLFRLVESERVFFINVFRPGYGETGQRILDTVTAKHSPHLSMISLDPLDDRKSEILITNMLNFPGVHHTIVRQIVRRAGGNPYFIEEVVRSFIDEGAVVVKGGELEVTSKFNQVTIPNTINDVLMSRIDRLEEETHDLLKVAAVIGRNFFYRILSVVAGPVPDLDDRLSYLKETQLIRERERMEELEYLFNHALAQEATYASILPARCKALHLKVADTIEKVFAKKLHAFYGMLAFHYSRAGNFEKTEDALIKAGEEALKTSASSEALHYYQEALSLYRQKSGQTIDAGKVALLEKNIALAFYNRGQYEEAVEYFEKALDYYWGQLPKNAFSKSCHILSALTHFMAALYFPFLKFRKEAKPEEIETIELFYKKNKALSIINPKQLFIEALYLCKKATQYQLSNFDLGLNIYVASSSLFSFTGISFRLSQKILQSSKKFIRNDQAKIHIIYDFMETIHNYLLGNWKNIGDYDLDLVNKNLKEGEVYAASQHLYWHGCPILYMGCFDQAQTIQNELTTIAEVYENDFSILLNYMFKIKLFMERRRLNEALSEIDNGVEFAKKKKFIITLLDFYSCQTRLFIFRKDLDNAAVSLRKADEIRSSTRATPIQLSIYFRSKSEFFLSRLEEALQRGDKSAVSDFKKKAAKACGKLIKATKKAAQHRAEAYGLKGTYYWLLDKPGPAFNWMDKAVREGERLGARLELSRIYFDIGKRLMASDDRTNHLNGITAEKYLEKAKMMFQEMNLQSDLDQLDRLAIL